MTTINSLFSSMNTADNSSSGSGDFLGIQAIPIMQASRTEVIENWFLLIMRKNWKSQVFHHLLHQKTVSRH